MPKGEKKKEGIPEGVFEVTTPPTELEEMKKGVIPYIAIIKAVKAGKGYLLPAETNRSTITQALKRINETLAELKDTDVTVKLMKTKGEPAQLAIVPT